MELRSAATAGDFHGGTLALSFEGLKKLREWMLTSLKYNFKNSKKVA